MNRLPGFKVAEKDLVIISVLKKTMQDGKVIHTLILS